MKKYIIAFTLILFAFTFVHAGSKEKGEQCFSDNECEFQLQCKDGVCVKKSDFDYGSSGKTGKKCSIDADCIGSGKCVEGSFGQKVCSGN